MNDIFSELETKKVLVSDGAWGTMLQEKGLNPGDCPEEWNTSHPDIVRSIAEAYFKAGSEIVLTNSFGGNLFKLSKQGFEEEVETLNCAAAQLSKQAVNDRAFVFASVGPCGEFLEPLGTVTSAEMIYNFKIQIQGLSRGGADVILIETMSDLGEAVCAIRAAKKVSELPIAVTITFEKGSKGFRTMMGTSIEQSVKALIDEGVDLLGTNCGNGIDEIIEIIAQMRSLTEKYLIAHPNAGLPKLVNGKTVFDQTPDEMANKIPALIEAGANIVGGCCGTNPAHIKAISSQVRKIRQSL